MIEFWSEYPNIENELIEVQKLMRKTINNADSFISEPIDIMLNSKGKMLRPALTIISSMFGEYDPNKTRPVAAALELLHISTLIHDDIIDDSKLRRGVETIQSKYGKDVAVYAGDYVITKCFSLLYKEYDKDLLFRINSKLSKVCEGELKQYKNKYNSNISVTNYIKIISAKTASFFALSMYIGASLGGYNDSTSRLFALTGLRLGIAFQIIDDCLDFTGNDTSINKSAQNDLKEGLYTLPLIFALRNDSTGNLKRLVDTSTFNSKDIDDIYKLVIKNNGVVDAHKYAAKYSQRSIDSLKKLPKSSNIILIEDLIVKLTHRTY